MLMTLVLMAPTACRRVTAAWRNKALLDKELKVNAAKSNVFVGRSGVCGDLSLVVDGFQV